MKLRKRYLIFVLLIAAVTLTSYYFLNYKPKTSKYSKAKLVFETKLIDEFGERSNECYR